MRFLYCILPFLGAAALTSELEIDKCQCPQVKCRTDDAVILCNCLNDREAKCKAKCPEYIPTFVPCPAKPSVIPTPTPPSKPVTCECPDVKCTQVWPGSCYCAQRAAQKCYEKCGGEPPEPYPCGSKKVIGRAVEPQEQAKANCECEQTLCSQVWPNSCYCANAAAEMCYKKCGGPKATLQQCPPMLSKSIVTRTYKPISTIKPTPTPTLLPPNPHKICGGFRNGNNLCDEGSMCIKDPYTPGCGPECDALGICVSTKMCGGFAGFSCLERGQVCHDNPIDSCDPNKGGADCGGLCIWPHRSLGSDV
ncbi:hypothetical protein GQ44DRAFT_437017 [Phaeosphaeriaceae sp. PMI808]|nr:hypothetical protein GQ44DRAFT_437017 [Phaeosphaeriaceae sp. PMI808]